MKIQTTLLGLLCLLSGNILAQDYHFLQFTDKNTTSMVPSTFLSAKSIERRTKQSISIRYQDYPVNSAYLDSLEDAGLEVIHTTKWLNGALVKGTQQAVDIMLDKPFIRKTTPINTFYGGTRVKEVKDIMSGPDYGASESQTEMLELDVMHERGYTGKGISIAVFDSGFPSLTSLDPFQRLVQNNQIKYTYSFVNNSTNVYGTSNGQHGLNVFSTIGAYVDGQIIGAAYDADFYLFETEDSGSESPLEELNWLFAAERADSLGVDIITTSLGYNDFDGVLFDFVYADLDGDKTIITQAADLAAGTGILVIASAGNEGSISWEKIVAPADGDSVLAVGAVNSAGSIMSFSSRGPSADGRIKPDVMAQGGSVAVVRSSGSVSNTAQGTSFSTPIMAGFAACLWQENPTLTNMQLLTRIQQSGHLADDPDNNYGYGIPNYSSFRIITSLPEDKESLISEVIAYPNPLENNYLKLAIDPQLVGEKLSLRLTNASGKVIANKRLTAKDTILELRMASSKLANGMYFLQVNYGNSQKTLRISIK